MHVQFVFINKLNLNSVFWILGSTDFGESDGDDEAPALKRLESELMSSSEGTADTLGGDLFSEIHLNELRKLEKKLEEVCY